MSEADGGCQRLLEAVRGHQYVGLKIFQEGLHFGTPYVPHLGYLGYIYALYPILGYIIQSTNKNPVLQNKNTKQFYFTIYHYITDISL